MDPNQIHPDNLKPNPSEPVFPPSSTPNEIEQTKRLSKRVLLAMFLILIILVPSGLFLYSKFKQPEYKSASYQTPTPAPTPTPTPDPTADWKTYNDLGLGYSVKYPSSWFVYYGAVHSYDPSKIFGSEEFSEGQFKFEVSKDIPPASISDELNIISVETITVDGIPAKRKIVKIYPYERISTSINVFIQRERDNFSISGYYNEAERDKYIKIFDQMMSTFKFIDQADSSPSATPSGEQTVCTQEAKLCPDGSYVSREGPNCEFPACPQ